MRLKVNDDKIIWPGRRRIKPEGVKLQTHLKVLTIEEKPFVYVRHLKDEVTCAPDEILCPHFNNSARNGKLKLKKKTNSK